MLLNSNSNPEYTLSLPSHKLGGQGDRAVPKTNQNSTGASTAHQHNDMVLENKEDRNPSRCRSSYCKEKSSSGFWNKCCEIPTQQPLNLVNIVAKVEIINVRTKFHRAWRWFYWWGLFMKKAEWLWIITMAGSRRWRRCKELSRVAHFKHHEGSGREWKNICRVWPRR